MKGEFDMKKFLSGILAICMSVSLIAGCGCDGFNETETTENEQTYLPIEDGLIMMYASGAGAWATNLYLNSDGSFTGDFSDTDIGEMTVYECSFSGRFSQIEKIEDYAYKMHLESIKTDNEEGEESFYDMGDGNVLKVVQAAPYGVDGGEEFVFYLPNTPIDVLDEEFLSWALTDDNTGETLGRYGLYNINGENGFFEYGD